jgi:hypothetical protein
MKLDKYKAIGEPRRIPMADIEPDFFVRRKMNHQHVRLIEEAYMAMEFGGKPVPPIIVYTVKDKKTGNVRYHIIDGRHREQASIDLGREFILAQEVQTPTELDKFAIGLESNLGGHLPANLEDYNAVLVSLLDAGYTRPAIIKSLADSGIPDCTMKRALANAQSAIDSRNIRRAAQDIEDNPDMSMQEAADKWGVNVVSLRDFMFPKNKKKGVSSARLTNMLMEKAKQLTSRYILSVKGFYSSVSGAVETGKISQKHGRELFDFLDANAYTDRKQFKGSVARLHKAITDGTPVKNNGGSE